MGNQSAHRSSIASLFAAIGAAGLIGMAFAPAAVRAGVIVNDTWKDGTRTDPAATVYSENGVDSDTDGDIESAWYQGGAGTLDPAGAGGPLHGDLNLNGTSSASWTTYLTPESSKVTLAPGDKLRITWTFMPDNVNASNTSQFFRVALVNTATGSRLTGNGAPSAAFTGYGMFMNMGQTLGNSNPFRIVERTNTSSSDLLSTSGNWTSLGTTGAASGNHGYDSGTSYTFVMDVTRNALDGIDVTATMTGGTLNGTGTATTSFTDATPSGGSFTFDTFGIRPSGATTTAQTFDTTLFRAELISAPEPASLGLLAIAAMPLVRRRRAR